MVTGLIMGTFIGIGLGESYFVKALRHIDVSQAYPISICGYPVVTVLLATLFLRELLTWAALLGTLLVITGVYLIAFPKGGIGLKLVFSSASQRTGLWLVFLTVITWAVATIIIKQSLGHGDLVVANFIRLSGNAFLIFLLTRPYWQSFHPRHQGWLRVSSAGLTGILSFGIGGILFLVGLQYAGAAKTSVLASTSPLFLVPMAVFFLKERVTAKLISGVILSIIGITMVVT
jgi:drug/metabolite transporter (DMT)-like permease